MSWSGSWFWRWYGDWFGPASLPPDPPGASAGVTVTPRVTLVTVTPRTCDQPTITARGCTP